MEPTVELDVVGDISASGDLVIGGIGNVSASLATIPTNNNQLTNGAGYTTNTGTVTSVGTGNGLTGTVTSTGNISVDYAGTSNIITSAPNDGSGYDSSDKIIRYSDGDEEVQDTTIANFKSGYNLVDTLGTPIDNDYAKFTDANTIEGRSFSEVKTDLSLNNVENTALSTYTGNGGALDNQYITNGANNITAANQLDGQYIEYFTRTSAYGNGSYEGEVLKWDSDTTQAGKTYVYSGGVWTATDADSENKTKGLFGIALGSNSGTDGMLIKGARASSAYAFTAGDILYISATEGSCLLYTSPSPRDRQKSRMPSSA